VPFPVPGRDGAPPSDAVRRPITLAHLLALVAALLFAACGGDADDNDPATAPVEIQVRWVVDSLPIGVEIEIFEAHPDDRLMAANSYAEGDPVPLGAPIPDAILRTGFDEPARFVMLLRNRSAESFSFWAAPHLALPIQAETDLVITCLCTGELYEVEAGGSWRRVVEYGLSQRSDVREPLSITHVFTRGDLPTPD
jgi:hypothetical protein